MNHLVVIRDYGPGDELHCQEIVKEGTMSTVNAAFVSGLTREITFQAMILAGALMFIFLGVPLGVCVAAVPVVVALMYVCVWLGHVYKVAELSQDVANIPRAYMSSEDTGFWVAEAVEPPLMTREPAQVKYTLLTEGQLKAAHLEVQAHHRRIVGTIAVSRSRHSHDCAWLRRMAVSSKYQRKGIASALVDRALAFCKERGYSCVELVTSECHDAARGLYLKKGFELKQLYHRQVVGTLVTVLMYNLVYKLGDEELLAVA